jgi:hypothetical protein
MKTPMKSKLMGSPMPKASPTYSAKPMPKGAGKMMDEERKMRAQDALSTMTRAEEHRKDKGLMADVKKIAMDRMDAMACAVGMKK